ncbi:hypothetical protein E6H33_11735, partial [Candidatus Bathyarchaeota archaeon]
MTDNLLPQSKKDILRLSTILLIIGTSMVYSIGTARAASFTFTNYELGNTPRLSCPNTQGNCYNFAAEPA